MPKFATLDQEPSLSAKLKVIGIGGGGCNAIESMMKRGLSGVEYVAINTDAQVLDASSANHKIQIGANLTKGLGAGADPNVGDYLHGVTPLMMCAKKGKLRIAEVLLKSGADPNIKDKIGSSALSRAEHNGDLEMIKMLKKYGAQ